VKKALFILGGLGLLGFGVYKYFKTQVATLSNFTWKVTKFKILKISLSELSIDVNFLIHSDADLEAKVNKLYLDLYLQGKNVGYISEEKGFVIPAKGSADIPLHISISPQSILKNIIDVTLGSVKNKDVMFKLNGFANIKSGFISTTLPITYETSIKQYLSGATTIS
jgi:LEA14-like dessication related protein